MLLSGVHLCARRLPARAELLLENIERDHVVGVGFDLCRGDQETRVIDALLGKEFSIEPIFYSDDDLLCEGQFFERVVWL